MILVADSGSSKTEWRIIDDEGKTDVTISSEGLNPYFLTQDEIAEIIRLKVRPLVTKRLDNIYFYGAGCGLPAKAKQIKDAIDSVIPTRNGATVTGDTLAAARSVLQNQPGICCILGTGSNGFVYDGQEITATVPSLGYLFSDWGSGTVLGKDFLALVLREELPEKIRTDFDHTFGLSRMEILQNVYNRPLANRFMASFTPFIFKYSEQEEIRALILENFRQFFRYYVLAFPEFRTFGTVSVVGSIGHHFKKYLLEVATEMNIGIDKVVKNPMDGLIRYHAYMAAQKTLSA